MMQQVERVFISTDHDSRYPVGVCSLVVAKDEVEARELLDAELEKHDLDPNSPVYTLREIDITTPGAVVLIDGDY